MSDINEVALWIKHWHLSDHHHDASLLWRKLLSILLLCLQRPRESPRVAPLWSQCATGIGYVTSETTFLLGERLDLYLGLGLGLGLVRLQLESEI